MSEEFEIRNKVAENTSLVNFDLASPATQKEKSRDRYKRLFSGAYFEGKGFSLKMISDLDTEPYKDCYVYIYCSVDAIVPIWVYFLLGDKLMSSAKKGSLWLAKRIGITFP